jgi:hypothetical protein
VRVDVGYLCGAMSAALHSGSIACPNTATQRTYCQFFADSTATAENFTKAGGAVRSISCPHDCGDMPPFTEATFATTLHTHI